MLAYPFLQNILPPLLIEAAPAISFENLMELFQMNLSKGDLVKVERIRLLFDLRNIIESSSRSLLFPYGNYGKEDLEQLVSGGEIFDQEILDMINQYDTPEELRKHFYPIFTRFLQRMISGQKGFVRDYYIFEYQMRVLLAGYRAKRLGTSIFNELNYEDLTDPFVADIVQQKDSPKFEFPYEFQALQTELESTSSPGKEHEVVFRYKFNHFQKIVDEHYDSVDSLLAYMVQLIYLEGYFGLDSNRGQEIIQQLLKDKQ